MMLRAALIAALAVHYLVLLPPFIRKKVAELVAEHSLDFEGGHEDE